MIRYDSSISVRFSAVMNSTAEQAKPISPLRPRLIVYFVLAVVAIASIWMIDRRAMERMGEQEDRATMEP